MLLFQSQQRDLLFQRHFPVKGGIFQDSLNIFQRKLQFPEQQDLLQTFQRCIVIQAVAAVGMPGSGQQADLVIIVQRAYTHAGQLADFVYGHHGGTSLSLAVSIAYTMTQRKGQDGK